MLVVVNLDPFAVHEGVCVVPAELGLHEPFDVVDALTGESYGWGGAELRAARPRARRT